MKANIFSKYYANIAIFLTLALLSVLALFPTVVAVSAEKPRSPIYSGRADAPGIALMFNVYWGTEYIEPILDALDAASAKATFFIGGSWADDNNELIQKIAERGHEIGNHGYLHRDHKKLNAQRNEQEIMTCDRLLTAILGKLPSRLFAPPSGSFSDVTLTTAERLGFKVIMWSKDTIDWRDKDQNLVYSRATSGVKAGDLILMHPTGHTLAALPQILEYFASKNFKCITVGEAIGA
ncbi:MAG: polysaccharide deacetylase family protein [Christensenellales bacterium]|jgi:peptidoglycan/xylan/chitin deacetylase (PgdA/CDA1 family)|nr:polysaccharide deacetylase family protein [Clostridia bacterium]HRU84509.1 polysaccharide deacetylase family protein [Eubacteriales bacterium]